MQNIGVTGKALAAFADGVIPFWDPFSSYYNCNCDSKMKNAYGWSKSIGGWTRDVEIYLALRIRGPEWGDFTDPYGAEYGMEYIFILIGVIILENGIYLKNQDGGGKILKV